MAVADLILVLKFGNHSKIPNVSSSAHFSQMALKRVIAFDFLYPLSAVFSVIT